MSTPLINFISPEDARAELEKLESIIGGDLEEFERRAYRYELTATERATWDRIQDLRWLLDID
ncbi:hypothetical protein CPHO_00525 [Corynebacterium phocae]|uniref:Uncharacterized protein n=1 Tax=Corynebacterium phocae TaxID=161895 RepID=A0A1L7D121_9CORY|nr:hypothetical protein [Corynebacterium phocae]APT91661.1 hypothetical protein CPHO_00525 [Corynebacterium phocae]KAA8728635.1 hypothetical protein F4V58_00080 [Corynebacterium phocae]